MDAKTDRFPDTERRPSDEHSAAASPVFERVMPAKVGRYEIRELLGAGGMAEVYRAFDPTLNRAVALKFLRETSRDDLARFLREARAQAQIGHDNICDVYETGVVDGRPFIAMRCIDGVTLADAAPRMSIDEKVRVLADVAEAVHAAHRIGLVHRDLKPNNIMVEQRSEGGWHAWVLDFGLARDSSMDTMTRIFPVLACIKRKPGERITLVNNTIIEEVLQNIGTIDFGGGFKAKTNVSLWRTRGEHRPLIGEFSFQIRFEDRKDLSQDAIQKAAAFFISTVIFRVLPSVFSVVW